MTLRKKLTFILAICFGLLGGLLSYQYLNKVTETGIVYVFTKHVDQDQPISKDLLVQKELPLSAIPSDAITELNDIEGKSARGLVLKDSILRLNMIIATESSRMSGKLAENADSTALGHKVRAVALPISIDTTVGGTVETGDRIDIFGINSSLEEVVQITEDVQVLQGMRTFPEENSEKDKQQAVVIALSTSEVERLTNEMAKGAKIFVSLQPMLADEDDTENADLTYKGG